MKIDWTQILTAVLVLVTAIYAWLTRQAVEESRKSRRQMLKPILVVDPVPVGPVHLFLRLTNAGPGVALDAAMNFVWAPRNCGEEGAPAEQRFDFVWSAVAPGQQHQFDPVDYSGEGENQMKWLTSQACRIRPG